MTGWKISIFKMIEYGHRPLIHYFLKIPHLFKPADIQCKVLKIHSHARSELSPFVCFSYLIYVLIMPQHDFNSNLP